MTEQAQEQAAPAGEQVQNQEQQQESRTLTWEEHTRELQRVGKKEKNEGKKSGVSELLERSGAESADDLIAAWQSQQTIAEELEGQEVKDLKRQHKESLKAVQGELDSHKEALGTYLEKEREGLPEHITDVLDAMSAPDQLAYISKHADALRTAQRPATVGRGSAPGSGNGAPATYEGQMSGFLGNILGAP